MNNWTIHYYDKALQDWVKTMPIDIRAHYARLTNLLMQFGLDLRMPHSRAMGKGLFELRPKGKEGIGRVMYCIIDGQRIMMLHGFIKKTQKTPPRELKIAIRRMNEVKNEQKR